MPGEIHDRVLTRLGHDIVSGTTPAGTVLKLETLVDEFAVSRPVVREAVGVLESMGLVSSRRRVGITVQAPAEWNVLDPRLIRWRLDGSDRAAQLISLSELRRGFEPAAAALAATRATAAQCSALASAASDMVVHGRTGDLEPYLEADLAFHRIIFEATGNEMFRALSGIVDELLAGRTHHGMMPAQPVIAAIDLHDAVARAIRTRDPVAAEAAMRAIIDEAAHAVAVEFG